MVYVIVKWEQDEGITELVAAFTDLKRAERELERFSEDGPDLYTIKHVELNKGAETFHRNIE